MPVINNCVTYDDVTGKCSLSENFKVLTKTDANCVSSITYFITHSGDSTGKCILCENNYVPTITGAKCVFEIISRTTYSD